MLVELDVAVELCAVLATPTSISFSSLLDQAGLLLLLCQFLCFLLEFVLDLQFMLSQMVIFLCFLCLLS